MLSRLGFYSEPINSEYTKELMKSVEAFQENRGLTIDGVVGLNTVTEIKKLIRPNLDNSLNEAIKAFKRPGSMLNVCIYVENIGEYKEQVVFYESLKELANKSGIKVSFASEAGETLTKENIISFVNKINPSVFLTFENNQQPTVDYFQGKHSISNIGKKIAEIISSKIDKSPNGKNNMLLKNTRAVSIIINGNFYQINLDSIFDVISNVYSDIY